MDGYRCIYCPARSDKRFPREHVVPEGLGRFRDNLTIFCVCQPCNSHFGDGIERVFERDSLLGVLRLQHGLKPLSEASEIGRERLKTTVQRGGHLTGAPVRLDESNGQLEAVHEEVVGFSRPDGQVDWYRPGELTEEIVARYRPWPRITLVCREDHEEIFATRLRNLGATIGDSTESTVVPGGNIEVESSWRVGDDDLRVIGKIAFNYAARILGPSFVRGTEFDSIRQWIRFGESRAIPVTPHSGELLLGETRSWRWARGHVLTIQWDDPYTLASYVSLFNSLTFRVELCSRYHGVWIPVQSGHLFDLSRRIVRRLRGARPF